MSAPIAFWRAEHSSFARLLQLLETKVNAFHTGERPDYELMLDIVLYLRHFPDRYHHPREGVAFACLTRHDPELAQIIRRLHEDHRHIAENGDRLHELLSAALEGAVVGRDALETTAREYLRLYRQHIAIEEITILPQALRLLTDSDWAEVGRAHPDDIDPLFGANADESYRELRRQIALEAG